MGLFVPPVLPVKGVDIAADDLSPVQCRMARAALGWSLDDLAATAGVNRKTILRYEQGETVPRIRNLDAMRRAFEAAGLRFIDSGPDRGGVVPMPSEGVHKPVSSTVHNR